MYVIGLTGNISCGKSTVSKHLNELGSVIIDADKISKEITGINRAGWNEIRKSFGDSYFNSDGSLDRIKLAELVFKDKEQLNRLNNILHPLVKKEIQNKLDECRINGICIAVVDVPLLIECKWFDMVDEIWLVVLDENLQKKRLMQRNSLTLSQACDRIKSQMSQSMKKKYADKIIDNSGTIGETIKQVDSFWGILKGKLK